MVHEKKVKAIECSQVRLFFQHQIRVISKGVYSPIMKITNLISVNTFKTECWKMYHFIQKPLLAWKQFIQPKIDVVNSIALNVKGDTMFVFARLKILAVKKSYKKVFTIVEILQGMVPPKLINKMMTEKKLP